MNVIKAFLLEVEERFFLHTFPFYLEAGKWWFIWLVTVLFQAILTHMVLTWLKRLVSLNFSAEPIACSGPIFWGLVALCGLITIHYARKADQYVENWEWEPLFDAETYAMYGGMIYWVMLVFAAFFTYVLVQ